MVEYFDKLQLEWIQIGYGPVPHAVVCDSGLSTTERLVYVGLLMHDWAEKDRSGHRKGKVWVGQRTLAKELGVSYATVRRAIDKLAKRGYIDVDHGFKGKSNTYTLRLVVVGNVVVDGRGDPAHP